MKYTGHGNKEISERIIPKAEAKKLIKGLKKIAVTDRVARECIDIAYGFFTPLEGFMVKEDVVSVCKKMTLANGILWPIPILFDISGKKIKEKNIKKGDSILLTYQEHPLAILEIEDIFSYNIEDLKRAVLGTTNPNHPGVKMYDKLQDTFIGGKISLINDIKFNAPFDKFWYTPKQLRKIFEERGWKRIVAHQSRNVPHTGHEWLMKGAWFSANGDLSVEKLKTGILVSSIIGPKRIGDYIDEAIILGHQKLHEAKYLRDDVHLVSFILWDMRYAGPKEAILHAIIRSNIGCTHHMFGRDHAGVGSFYGSYDAHRIFDQIPEGSLNIKPILLLEWWFCPVCGEVTYAGLCGHTKQKQPFSGSMIRSMIQDKVKPTKLIMRPEVFNSVMENADKYGFGSPFCTEEYLSKRQPVFEVPIF